MEDTTPLDSFTAFFEGPYQENAKSLDGTNLDCRSLRIDWQDLKEHDPSLAEDFLSSPDTLRNVASEGIRNADSVDILSATIRIYNLPEYRQFRVGKYRTRQLGELLSVRGKVVDMDGVQPYAERAAFECPLCGTLTRLPQSYGELIKPAECQGCENSNPGFRFNREQSELVDFQKIVIIPPDSNLDEPPATIAFLKNDLVDMVGPGDFVTINGIYETFPKQSESTLSTYIEALDLDIEKRIEIDTYGASEIQEFIMETLTDRIEVTDDWAVPRAEVVDAVVDAHGVRREEIDDQINALIDDNDIGEEGSKLFDI